MGRVKKPFYGCEVMVFDAGYNTSGVVAARKVTANRKDQRAVFMKLELRIGMVCCRMYMAVSYAIYRACQWMSTSNL